MMMTRSTKGSTAPVRWCALLLAVSATRGAVGQQASGDGSPVDRDVSSRVDVPRLLRTVGTLLDAAVRDSAFPGAVAVVGTRDGVLVERAAGHLDWAPSDPVDAMTLWDLASLTKVVGLTTAVMQLVEQHAIDLDGPVARYLPEFRGAGKERVTVRHLLSHSAGLPAWRPLYQEAPDSDSALGLVFATPLDTAPGARMVYSDLGAILLGQMVHRVSGERFDRYVETRILAPLRMRETMFRPPPALRARVAPTEFDPWRGRQVRGEVHDENAFALGGVSSHAGLFSTARDLTRFARMLLAGGTLEGVSIVRPETIAAFTKVQDPSLSHRALGWETANGTNSGGHLLSSRAFGHTGFTGTSLWIDPANNLFILLLSNRVNPTRERRGIFAVRVALADAVLSIVGSRAVDAR
ncbi:MAG TPA: serine hydrolase domain-containing protein [Gemmatimonadales bacterium]